MKIIFASNNEGKVKETKKILDTKLDVVSLRDIGFLEDIDEYGETFHINALIKAQEIARKYPDDVIIADDSGLCVAALDGAPGVYSARYAKDEPGYNKEDFVANNNLLLKNMKGIENRKAYFISVLCVIFPGEEPTFFTGKLYGEIGQSIEGTNGFGYDVVFELDGRSLALYSEDEKNAISHRRIALDKLKKSKLLDRLEV